MAAGKEDCFGFSILAVHRPELEFLVCYFFFLLCAQSGSAERELIEEAKCAVNAVQRTVRARERIVHPFSAVYTVRIPDQSVQRITARATAHIIT